MNLGCHSVAEEIIDFSRVVDWIFPGSRFGCRGTVVGYDAVDAIAAANLPTVAGFG